MNNSIGATRSAVLLCCIVVCCVLCLFVCLFLLYSLLSALLLLCTKGTIHNQTNNNTQIEALLVVLDKKSKTAKLSLNAPELLEKLQKLAKAKLYVSVAFG